MILQEVYENQYYRYAKLLLQETTDEFTEQNKKSEGRFARCTRNSEQN